MASGALAQCEHATSSWINSLDSIQSNSKEVVLYFFVNWIESNFPRPKMEMPSWSYSFFGQSDPKFNSITNLKNELDSFFFLC